MLDPRDAFSVLERTFKSLQDDGLFRFDMRLIGSEERFFFLAMYTLYREIGCAEGVTIE